MPPASVLHLYDTLSRTSRPLVPIVPGRVGVYLCGVTVDGPPHLGHARSAVAFDVLVRVLRRRGLHVTYVRNFTDVDDRILRRAREEGVAPEVVAERNLLAYRRAMRALGVEAPDHEPRVTEHVEGIVAMVATLVERGHAYAVDGDVWFHVPTKADYGKLSGRDIADQRSGVRIEPDPRKRHPADFALWKAAGPGEPSWPSPWGRGRPGWHIECSAMSRALLGDRFDVHGGGLDLVFPHHENEIAQTEAATGTSPMASTWMHNGMLTVAHEKMAKSVGNVRTVDAALERHAPEAIRAWLLSAHYRSPLELSEQGLVESGRALERLYDLLTSLGEASGVGPAAVPGREPASAPRAISLLETEIEEALFDDLDTPRALAALYRGTARIVTSLSVSKARSGAGPAGGAAAVRDRIVAAAEPLGLLRRDPTEFAEEVRTLRLAARGLARADVDARVAARDAARAGRDFAEADRQKAELSRLGVELRDSASGTVWHVLEPAQEKSAQEGT